MLLKVGVAEVIIDSLQFHGWTSLDSKHLLPHKVFHFHLLDVIFLHAPPRYLLWRGHHGAGIHRWEGGWSKILQSL